MSYSGPMGMGSLAKYRRIFMIFGFSIFLLGALGRWHRNRQLGAVEQKSQLITSPTESWHGDCLSYACRVLPARKSACNEVCDRAISEGTPKTQAERIALACKSYCSAQAEPIPGCATECFVKESKRSANPG